MGRIGPDSGCLRGSPVFARAGARFESHLGHVFSCSGACEPLSVHKLFTFGPFRGPFLVVAGDVAERLRSGVDDGSAFLPLHGGVGPRLHDLSQVGDVRSWRSIRPYQLSSMTVFWFRHGGLCRPQWNRD